MRFPAGEVDLTSACQPGGTHVLSLLVVAMPLQGVMLSFSDTASAREVQGSVARRGLCGDVYLLATPAARLADVKVDTSVRKGEITVERGAAQGLAAGGCLHLAGRGHGRTAGVLHRITSKPFRAADLKNGRIAFTEHVEGRRSSGTSTRPGTPTSSASRCSTPAARCWTRPCPCASASASSGSTAATSTSTAPASSSPPCRWTTPR